MASELKDPARPVRIVVVGAGAVGCFYASRLHRPPYTLISLVARSNFDAIRAQGGVVRLKTRDFGEYAFRPHAVFRSVAEASQHAIDQRASWDYVVVATKALPDIADDSAIIASLISAASQAASLTTVVLIQNGVGVEVPYRARFPQNPILSGVTVVSAEQAAPGYVVQNRWTRISLGPYTDGVGDGGRGIGDAKADEFAALLALGGIKDAEVYPEKMLQMVRWHKTAINAAMNPSAVLSSSAGNAVMSQDEELSRHLTECMREVFRGAEAVLGQPMPSSLATPERILESSKRNTDGRPSMLLDWERGQPMELEVILGNCTRLSRSKGVVLPRLETMYALLKMAQAQARRRKAKL